MNTRQKSLHTLCCGWATTFVLPPVCRHSLCDSEGRLMLKNLTLPELQEWCTAVGEQQCGPWDQQPLGVQTPAAGLMLRVSEGW